MTSNPVSTGRWAMFQGHMSEYRQRLGLSKAVLADILDVSVTTIYRWEGYDPLSKLNDRNSEQVYNFCRAAEKALQDHPDFPERYIPLAVAAQRRGVTQEWLLQEHRAGNVDLHDFGILGLFQKQEKQ